jgi:hypothetical protein
VKARPAYDDFEEDFDTAERLDECRKNLLAALSGLTRRLTNSHQQQKEGSGEMKNESRLFV